MKKSKIDLKFEKMNGKLADSIKGTGYRKKTTTRKKTSSKKVKRG